MPPGRSRLARQPATTGSSTTVTAIVVGVILVGLLAITGLVALLRGSDDGTDSGAPAAASSTPPGSATTPSPSVSSEPTKSPTKKPATKTPPGPAVSGRTYTGTGNEVVKIKKPGNTTGPVLLVATHSGGGSFGVLALDAFMDARDILVNVAGPYQGTTVLDPQGTQTQNLKVRARGTWTLKLKPVTAARSVDARAKGTGDAVLRYTGNKGLASFDCRGSLNFVVTYYGQQNTVLVDDVGSYHGQVRIEKGPALISVKANAPWSMDVAP